MSTKSIILVNFLYVFFSSLIFWVMCKGETRQRRKYRTKSSGIAFVSFLLEHFLNSVLFSAPHIAVVQYSNLGIVFFPVPCVIAYLIFCNLIFTGVCSLIYSPPYTRIRYSQEKLEYINLSLFYYFCSVFVVFAHILYQS